MEISKLRVMVVDRDKELREYQDLFAKEKKMKEFGKIMLLGPWLL